MAFTFTSDTLPADHKAAIRQMKQQLRAQLGDVQLIFNQLSDAIATRVAEINALKAQGSPVWPVLSYADIKAGRVSAEQREEIKRRGCAVIKGHFPREQALAWDQSMLDYLDRNHFDEVYKGLVITFLAPSAHPARRSTPSTGPGTDAGARAKKWPMHSYSLIACGRLQAKGNNGLTRMSALSTLTAYVVVRREQRPKGWARIRIPARWNVGFCRHISRFLRMFSMVNWKSTIRGRLRIAPK